MRAGDVLAAALATGAPLEARPAAGGAALAVDARRWLGPLTAADETVLARARGPVLDVGCGPGRHVRALAARGMLALGVELHPEVAALAARAGAPVHEGSIFDRIPGAGAWRTALLLDGSVGIGGDPAGLLRRVRELLQPVGAALVEAEPPGHGLRRMRLCLHAGGAVSAPFGWTTVGVDALAGPARAAGLRVEERWCAGGRWFARLEPA